MPAKFEPLLGAGMQEQFIKERIYFKNVSPKTVDWYNCAFKAFEGALESRQTILNRVAELRGRGVSAISVNTYLRCVNAYLMWLHKEQGKDLIRIPRLKEEEKILPTFSAEQVTKLVRYSPKGKNERRIHTFICLGLDTGLRLSEILSLKPENVDLDNLVIKVRGKGNKHRLVPFSIECRKILFRYMNKQTASFIFGTSTGTAISKRNASRDMANLGRKLGMKGRFSPHVLRHSFACEYLRRGGNLEFLRRLLGHSSILTTQKYLRSLGIGDLQEVHNALSLLSR